ncbi:putative serine protease EDA2-like isoform 2 protein [Corchorus olitorius]|uniref:Serine protease EDA2-like isoform 2 protein n=1 Tax=Corchorus olitorius TaxID=93759 RepID=A0A1R3I039_9ROSI|nr:putative serine protease EDA2-like isoform 2 protein [Corchorus olitorius]
MALDDCRGGRGKPPRRLRRRPGSPPNAVIYVEKRSPRKASRATMIIFTKIGSSYATDVVPNSNFQAHWMSTSPKRIIKVGESTGPDWKAVLQEITQLVDQKLTAIEKGLK